MSYNEGYFEMGVVWSTEWSWDHQVRPGLGATPLILLTLFFLFLFGCTVKLERS